VGLQAAAVLGVLALLAFAWAWHAARSGRRIRAANELRETQIARRLRGRSDDEERLRDARRQQDALLTRLGVPDLATGAELLEKETAHVAGIDRLAAELRGALGGETPTADLAILRDQAAAEAERARHALAGMGEVGADPERARLAAQEAVRATQRRRDQARDERGEARGRVDSNPVDAEQVAALAEAVLDAEERLAALERRVKLYQATLDAIGDAERATMKKAARYLEDRMGRDLASITDGRYARIRVDEAALAFSVWSAEKEAWVGIRDLSRGTVDQLYLAARLGLVRQVTQERTPPLIFDDPFVTFDDVRARRAVELLRQLAQDHQVLYLTTSTRYDDMADTVIELPAPASRDVPAPEPAAEEHEGEAVASAADETRLAGSAA
jgi:DNA repair exonuclease SbcCD ATPase subunit